MKKNEKLKNEALNILNRLEETIKSNSYEYYSVKDVLNSREIRSTMSDGEIDHYELRLEQLNVFFEKQMPVFRKLQHAFQEELLNRDLLSAGQLN